jgi:pyruvate-formate lyase-activating enzyme
MTVFSSLARDDGVLFTPVETTVVFSSCHFDCRRSRNGEISFRDLSASVAALTPVEVTVFFSRARDDGVLVTPVEMTGISSEAGMQKPHARDAALP